METRTKGKGTIDRGLRESMGTLADANPTRSSKRSQGCPLTHFTIGGINFIATVQSSRLRDLNSELINDLFHFTLVYLLILVSILKFISLFL